MEVGHDPLQYGRGPQRFIPTLLRSTEFQTLQVSMSSGFDKSR